MKLTYGFFKVSNDVFSYGLKPVQIAVYCYLLCRAGQKDNCWPSMRTIARSVGCSVNTARSAMDELVRRGFIRKVPTYQQINESKNRQSNNTYYVLDLPPLPDRSEKRAAQVEQHAEDHNGKNPDKPATVSTL